MSSGIMNLNQPYDFSEDLTEERLRVVCDLVLDTVQDSIEDSGTKHDTAWTRGCLRYGRVQGLFSQLTLDKDYPWISLANSTMDFTFKIGNTHVQYIYDDYECPKKIHRLRPNAIENMQLEIAFETEEKPEVLTWRLFVHQDLDEDFSELKATLVGYDINQSPICTWFFEDKANVPVLAERAETVELPEPLLTRKTSHGKVSNETD